MRIAILGYGKQGRSAYEYWHKPGNEITICDQNMPDDLPSDVANNIGPAYMGDLDQYDLIVRSPIIHPDQIAQENQITPDILSKVTTVTNEFFKVCPCPIIGVTGTKGKGTTSTLIAKILEQAGRRVHLGGNIGIPPLDLLKNNIQPDDIVVLELANFQLIDLKYSPHIAVCLMIAPEHLDWHKDIYEYIECKKQLFVHQSSRDLSVFNGFNLYSEQIADVSPAIKIAYQVPPAEQEPDNENGVYVLGSHIYYQKQKICGVHDVALLGRHNLENVCAAIGATWDLVQGNIQILSKAISSFKGLPHRLELLRSVNKVTFYNDSFASNPEATIAAINSIKGSKVLILGGLDRGLPLQDLAFTIKEHEKDIRGVVLIGETAPKIAKQLQLFGFTKFEIVGQKPLTQIVLAAQQHAQAGDAIVFSPGFASFDMFKNFEERGDQFKQVVASL